MKKVLSLLLVSAICLGCLAGCGNQTEIPTEPPSETTQIPQPTATGPSGEASADSQSIVLSDSSITLNGKAVGTSSKADVFISNDIIYYEDRIAYESGKPYGEGTASQRHSADEAAAHTVVNITAPGVYRISGCLSRGQIRVDLGKDADEDPGAVVTLILDSADITCSVAPAILFLNVYECDGDWDEDTATAHVDTAAAGANLLTAEGSVNRISGSHVAKIFKDKDGKKKLWKQDAAIYSYMSMNVGGSGTLELTADNEGLGTELHLTILSGKLNIRSGNDGINTKEDGVSVTTINGGQLHIVAGLGAEGDGIDSNGYLVINGGTVVSFANPASDAGLDSDKGSYIHGGTVIALGSTMNWAESDSQQVTMNLQFAAYRDPGNAIAVTDAEGNFVFAYDPCADEVLGENARRYKGAVISSPNLLQGGNYRLYIGGQLTGAEETGIYTSVESYENGILQAYTGTDVSSRPSDKGGMEQDAPGDASTVFYMQDKVNCFSGITAAQ